MINLFTNNLTAKIICLLLAFSFWTYVVSGEAKVDNFPGSLAIEVKNRPENLVVVKDVNEVEIRIMAERGVWQKLSSGSFEAYIDLSGLSQGTHDVAVNVRSSVDEVQIVEVKPAKILVSMEPVVHKTIEVKSKTEGIKVVILIPSDLLIMPSLISMV